MSQRTVRVTNTGPSIVTLRDGKTGNVYRLGDRKGIATGLVKHPQSDDIPADEWARFAKIETVQDMLKPHGLEDAILRVG